MSGERSSVTTSQPSGSEQQSSLLRAAIRTECERLEEDALYSARGHFEAARLWGRVHLGVGVPTAVLAALASVSAFNALPEVVGAPSILVAAMSAVSTFLNPSEKAQTYHQAGTAFNSVRSRTRILREITSLSSRTDDDLAAILDGLTAEKDELNQSSPLIPRPAFERARKGIEAGESSYKADAGAKLLR